MRGRIEDCSNQFLKTRRKKSPKTPTYDVTFQLSKRLGHPGFPIHDFIQSPESNFLYSAVAYHESHALQLDWMVERSIVVAISEALSRNWTARPSPTCQACNDKCKRQRINRIRGSGLRDTYNMAMHKPSTRIVCLKSNHQPSGRWKHGDIATRRVDEVQG